MEQTCGGERWGEKVGREGGGEKLGERRWGHPQQSWPAFPLREGCSRDYTLLQLLLIKILIGLHCLCELTNTTKLILAWFTNTREFSDTNNKIGCWGTSLPWWGVGREVWEENAATVRASFTLLLERMTQVGEGARRAEGWRGWRRSGWRAQSTCNTTWCSAPNTWLELPTTQDPPQPVGQDKGRLIL